MNARFRKKPVEIEAMHFNGNEGAHEICKWAGSPPIQLVISAVDGRCSEIQISTLEGTMTASLGDWIIRGVQGEFYPCKPDIFEATYDSIEDHA